LYLLTFVLVFAPRTILPLRWMVRAQSVLIVVTATTLLFAETGMREIVLFGSLHLATFFVTAMVCHGQLAADRPEPSRLTEFYLWMSLGGVLGGLFSALVAPIIFRSVLEYPLMMAAACMLRPRNVSGTLRVPSAGSPKLPSAEPAVKTEKQTAHGVCLILWRRRELLPVAVLLLCLIVAWGLRSDGFLSGWHYTDSPGMRLAVLGLAALATFLLRRGPAVFGVAVAMLAAISLWSVETGTRLLHAERSFFGILRVEYDPIWNKHELLHGTTSHGEQSLSETQRHEPQGYYHRTGPLGGIFDICRTPLQGPGTQPGRPGDTQLRETHSKPRRLLAEVGVLGLGAGTVAAYAEPGERFTFYEIDPAVERIAKNTDYFTYLADCRGTAEVILGDARLSLEQENERKFDLLVVDVFSSDSVPVHLMTREAFQIYFDHLKPQGLLAVHISSRYLDLEPFLGKLAEAAGRTARIWRDNRDINVVVKFASVWVVMAGSPEDHLDSLAGDARWQPLVCDKGPVWTDDFSNVAAALRWKSPEFHLIPAKWNQADRARKHSLLATALADEGRLDEAIEHFEKSLEIEPDSAPNHYSLGIFLSSRARTDEALEQLQDAVNLAPDFAMAHSALGIALDRKGRTDEALEHFRRAVEIDPGYVEGLCNLGKALSDRQQYDEAADCYFQAIALKPGNAEIRFDLGHVLRQQEKIEEALAELRRALPLAEKEKNAALVEKIEAEIRRDENWPWDDEGKK
jgi:tetratricopeptide (TPR) repeat protein